MWWLSMASQVAGGLHTVEALMLLKAEMNR
jgi:hypothetical protein